MLNGSNSVPPSPIPVLDPILRRNSCLTLTTSLGSVYVLTFDSKKIVELSKFYTGDKNYLDPALYEIYRS